jgi:hypothetical protein
MTIVGRETPQHFMRKRFGKNCEMSWLSNDLEIPIMTITSSPAMESDLHYPGLVGGWRRLCILLKQRQCIKRMLRALQVES